ncbi:uroporphyrinogen-III C-methyltransferase [Neisseria leonii]|uniref:uroporphyrinogen-III C-methyltransferase n=1 Tax=Neisseria leonii TaxID=2995413 RepID=UPI0030CE6A01
MSEQENRQPDHADRKPADTAPVPAVVQAASSAADAQTAPPAAPVIIKQSGGRVLAGSALVLSLLALGAGGFLFVQGQNVLKNQELALNQKIEKAALGESGNAALLQESLRRQEEAAAQLAQLESAGKAQGEQIARANRAYQELLRSRTDWLVNEVESALNTASQQLLLSGNVPAAVRVLENIENRLQSFDQAALLPIKQAVSADLAELKKRQYLDVSGTALRLDRLESAVSGLPLTIDNTLKPAENGAPPAVNTDGTWWESLRDKTLSALQGLVEVRRLKNGDAMLMSPEQVYFVRENLRLRLLDARTAMLRHNGDIYLSDLNSAEAAVKQYFDTGSPAVQAWLKELAELKTLDVGSLSGEVLKAGLTAVKDYQDNARATVSGADAAASEAAASAPAPSAASVPQAGEASAPAASAPQEKAASQTEIKGEAA